VTVCRFSNARATVYRTMRDRIARTAPVRVRVCVVRRAPGAGATVRGGFAHAGRRRAAVRRRAVRARTLARNSL